MDRRLADTEPLGDRTDRQESLGSQELCPPLIRRNSVRERVSIRSIGHILWQTFHGVGPLVDGGESPSKSDSRHVGVQRATA
jgi:hypothetical protein